MTQHLSIVDNGSPAPLQPCWPQVACLQQRVMRPQTTYRQPTRLKRRQRFAVSTYSFWQFKNEELRAIETCIDLASEWGFDGDRIT